MSEVHTALITGGAGFIGTNLADHLLSDGMDVIVLDDLSRPGVQHNVAWLTGRHPGRLRIETVDVRNFEAVRRLVAQADEVYHLAAQVAVTSSLEDPRHDFEVNVGGTLNVLEALRSLPDPPPLLYTSSNKVYGALEDIPLTADDTRYMPKDPLVRSRGVDEHRPLDFHSPYGCSKGAAEQYVLDYARCFGLRNIVFRMSCIYGPHQRGNEDQGWVAHFMMRARTGESLNIYGDGRQVRDVLYVGDLVEAFRLAMRANESLAGRAFNIGGGPGNTLSLLELISQLRERRPVQALHGPTRKGDQRYYVSNTAAFNSATGWRANTGVNEGLARLEEWLA